jgi:hypothetical protein
VLLSPAAFARLVQPSPADAAPAPVVKAPPRLDLSRPVAAPAAHRAPVAYTMAPQGSWASRHKAALGWTIVGGLLGAVFVGILLSCWGDEC